MGVEQTIQCIECGSEARLLTTFPPDAPPEPGDPLAYRCVLCNKRWDLVYEGDEDEGAGDDGWFARIGIR
jgi:DNA-directed RNA polymerase subunit RPC12/RpoP